MTLLSLEKFPKEITSYDLLKTFALVLMVVDHIGFYFFPDDLLWRAVGRICVPAWFFLVGYARSRDISKRMWIGGGVLVLANIVAGMPVLPLNILFSILAVRLLIDPVISICKKSTLHLWFVCALLIVLWLPTNFFAVEYGTLGLVLAMFGYFVRHKEEMGGEKAVSRFLIFSTLSFVVLQQAVFKFGAMAFFVMIAGVLAMHVVLMPFRSRSYPRLSADIPAPLVWFIQLCGRRSLEIYVVHLLLFKALALFLEMEGFGFFAFKLVDI